MEDPQAKVGVTTTYEITATSGVSFDNAIALGIESVGKDKRVFLRSIDVTGHRLNFADGKQTNYQVTLHVTLVTGDKPLMW